MRAPAGGACGSAAAAAGRLALFRQTRVPCLRAAPRCRLPLPTVADACDCALAFRAKHSQAGEGRLRDPQAGEGETRTLGHGPITRSRLTPPRALQIHSRYRAAKALEAKRKGRHSGTGAGPQQGFST